MTFQIITEPFIERELGLFIQKGEKETDQWNYLPSCKRVNWNGGNENIMAACLEWLTLHGSKDKLNAAFLKDLEREKWKIPLCKKKVFEQIR